MGFDPCLYGLGKGLLQSVFHRPPGVPVGNRGDKIAGKLLQFARICEGGTGHIHLMKLNHISSKTQCGHAYLTVGKKDED
jgi:hypothetical protein